MKRVYYFPGLISALVVPVLLWHFGNRKIEEITTSVIDFRLPAQLKKDNSNYNDTLEPLRSWNFKKIEVPAGKAKENSDAYVSEVKALQQRNEKHTGLEFILGEENTYGDFVSILNDMHISRHDEYGLDLEKTGNLNVPVTYLNPLVESCGLCGDVIEVIDDGPLHSVSSYESSSFDNIQDFLSQLTKEAYFLFLGFLILSYFSLISFRERFSKSIFN
ncbi:hypothetical protein BBI01_04910 [Chryseobacterium artocarpi]|uniref:Uncharacterized protein n=1 Tax=Chryseobacterium artocarpi TaxID=1414727 RepID=A0A1B8ZWT2_9FLAO|nr:hypothetical protein [Chryseobacterium artocarpi]OCA76039.1 hypothetical protein BBI01_04910 [Chryseobacterium artocarpi]